MGSSLELLVSHNFWTSELTAHKIDCTIPWTFSWIRYLCSNICKFSIQHREERSMSSSLVEMLKNWFINGILCNGCRCICRIVNLIVNIKFYCWAIYGMSLTNKHNVTRSLASWNNNIHVKHIFGSIVDVETGCSHCAH